MSMDTPDAIWADEAHARLSAASALCRDLNELAGWPPHSHVDRWARASREELLHERRGTESPRAFCARVLGTGEITDVTPEDPAPMSTSDFLRVRGLRESTTEALLRDVPDETLRTGLTPDLLRQYFREALLNHVSGRCVYLAANEAIDRLRQNGPCWDGVLLMRRGESVDACAYRVAMLLTSATGRYPVDVPAALRRLVAAASEPADSP